MLSLESALIGFGSALLAIVLTPLLLQHYFWRRQRHAELSLQTLERYAKVIVQLQQRLLKIQEEKSRTEADNDLLRRWDALGLEIQVLFSTETNNRLSRLNELIVRYSFPLETGGVNLSDFYKARTAAFSALYTELGLTGEQIAQTRWWQVWRL